MKVFGELAIAFITSCEVFEPTPARQPLGNPAGGSAWAVPALKPTVSSPAAISDAVMRFLVRIVHVLSVEMWSGQRAGPVIRVVGQHSPPCAGYRVGFVRDALWLALAAGGAGVPAAPCRRPLPPHGGGTALTPPVGSVRGSLPRVAWPG